MKRNRNKADYSRIGIRSVVQFPAIIYTVARCDGRAIQPGRARRYAREEKPVGGGNADRLLNSLCFVAACQSLFFSAPVGGVFLLMSGVGVIGIRKIMPPSRYSIVTDFMDK